MNPTKIILLNFSEIRRRSIKLWSEIPKDYMNWKPDQEAFCSLPQKKGRLQNGVS